MDVLETLVRFLLKTYQNPLTARRYQGEDLIEVSTKGASASRRYKAKLFSQAIADLYMKKVRSSVLPGSEEIDTLVVQLLDLCLFKHFDIYHLEGEYLRLAWLKDNRHNHNRVTGSSLLELFDCAVAGDLSCDIDLGCKLRLHHDGDCEMVGPEYAEHYQWRADNRKRSTEAQEDMLAVIRDCTPAGCAGANIRVVRSAFRKTRHGHQKPTEVLEFMYKGYMIEYVDDERQLVRAASIEV